MATTKWVLDPMHSEVAFKVKHLMITTVTGYFRTFNLEVDTDGDDFNTASRVHFTADIDSIDTNNKDRDTHLKSPDFFNSAEHAQLTFVGKKFEASGDEGTIQGDLTIRGITHPVTVDVELGGAVVDPYGQHKAGFTVTAKISRKAFGLTWSAVTEAGSVVVGDEIKLNAEIQLIKQG